MGIDPGRTVGPCVPRRRSKACRLRPPPGGVVGLGDRGDSPDEGILDTGMFCRDVPTPVIGDGHAHTVRGRAGPGRPRVGAFRLRGIDSGLARSWRGMGVECSLVAPLERRRGGVDRKTRERLLFDGRARIRYRCHRVRVLPGEVGNSSRRDGTPFDVSLHRDVGRTVHVPPGDGSSWSARRRRSSRPAPRSDPRRRTRIHGRTTALGGR